MSGQGVALLREGTRGSLGQVVISSALMACYQTAGVLVPVVAGASVDLAISKGDLGALARWTTALCALLAAVAVTGAVGSLLNFTAELTVAHRTRTRVLSSALVPSKAPDVAAQASETSLLITRDARQLGSVCRVIGYAVPSLVSMITGLVALLSTSARLAAVMVLGTVLVVVASRALSRLLVRRIDTERSELIGANALAEDLLSGIRTLKGARAEPETVQRYEAGSDAAARARITAIRWENAYTGVTSVLTGTLVVMVVWLGSLGVQSGEMTVGSLIAGVGLTQAIAAALDRLADTAPMLVRAATSLRNLPTSDEASDQEGQDKQATRGPAAAPSIHGAIAFLGMDLGGSVPVDAAFAAGTWTGMVLGDPLGTERLVTALSGEGPAQGSIHVDGMDLSTLDEDTARGAVLVCLPEAELFNGTVLDNVSSALPDGADHGPAVRAATVDEAAASLRDGLHTWVNERGRSLSGGQRQRVSLARALAADPPVLVLLDPLDSVDAVTELRIVEGMRDLRSRHTTIVLSRSSALLRVCDEVVYVPDTGPYWRGTHTQLCNLPDYEELVTA